MQAVTKIRVGVALALALVAALPGPAFAGTGPDTGPESAAEVTAPATVRPGLVPCVALAAKVRAMAWVCTADGLAVSRDARGKAVSTFRALKSTDYTTAATVQRTGGVSTLAVGDDYDGWCETGTICHRYPSNYAEETKGNAAYGNGSGAIGSYDAIIRTNLNGRQAQWDVTVIWDSGPSLSFYSTYMQCIQDWTVPVICGTHDLSDRTVTRTSFRYAYPRIYGNKLTNADQYHGAFHTRFTPAGYPSVTAVTLSTKQFTCPSGTARCYFLK